MASKPTLGLFFTDSFAEISGVNIDGNRLEKFGFISLPKGLVVNGEIKDTKGFLVVLRELLNTAKPSPIKKGSDVVVGVSDSKVFLREFSVIKPGRDIDEAIDYQARLLSPVLPSGVVTDWQIIGKAEEEIEVILAAVHESIISSYVAVCSSVGLRVIAVEPAILANIRIVLSSQMTGKNLLLVYMGNDYATFSLVTGGNPRFCESLAKMEIEKSGGIVKTIETYIEYANSKHPSRKIEGVIVSGFSEEVDSVVSTLVNRNVVCAKAVSRLSATETKDQTLMHTSHGLSFKLTDDHGINLLPLGYRLDVVREKVNYSWRLVIYFLIVLTLVIISGLYYLYRTTDERLVQQQAEKSSYERLLNEPASLDLVKQANEINLLTSKLVLFKKHSGGEENIFEILSAMTPAGITLTSVQFSRSPESVKLWDSQSAWMITGTANSRPDVLNFYSSLLTRAEFSRGRLYFGSLEKETGLSFRIASQTKQ